MIRNFSENWLWGAESVRTSNIRDHAKADQHTHAMTLLKREHARNSGSDPTAYAPIARALNRISDAEKDQLRHKFDIAYFMAIEKISFQKYPQLCELEARHGVAIGSSYTNEIACKSFTHFIAESQHRQLFEKLTQAKFFSLLIDGSTDKGNADDEVFVVVWCDSSSADEKMHTRTAYFHICRPKTVDANGLFLSLESALLRLGISDIDAENCKGLVGIGSDGASANIATGGLKGLVSRNVNGYFGCGAWLTD